MSPRPGGEAAKIGHRFETDWTVRQLLHVLAGQLESVVVEDVGELQLCSELTARTASGAVELHQVKRSAGSSSAWSVAALAREGVLTAAYVHGRRGHTLRLVSMTHAPHADALADYARRLGDDPARFHAALSRDQATEFSRVVDALHSEAAALTALRALWIEVAGETELARWNDALAAALFDVDPSTSRVSDALAAVVLRRLGVALTAVRLEEELATQGVRRLGGSTSAVAERVRECTQRWLVGVQRELLAAPLPRPQAEEVRSALEADRARVLVTGPAGVGKSAVLAAVVEGQLDRGTPVLALRLDWFTDMTTALALGLQTGLDRSPVAALAAQAAGERCVLVLDQLDAVSGLAGRSRAGLDVVGELLTQVSAFPAMRVLLSCRTFDAQNDVGLRSLAEDGVHVEVALLTPQQTRAAVTALGVTADGLSDQQLALFASPLNLVLLQAIADGQATAYASRTELFDAFWQHKRMQHVARGGTADGFTRALHGLVDHMSDRAQLTAPVAVLDEAGDELDLLVSADVVRRDGGKLRFFHESFFDYVFARRWVARSQSLRAFLRDGDQELFRRGQVRQVLVHLRDSDARRWTQEVEQVLLSPDVRFHLKDVVLAVLRALPDPTADDLAMTERVRPHARAAGFEAHLDSAIGSAPWFDQALTAGLLAAWLTSFDASDVQRSEGLLRSTVGDRGDDAAALLTDLAEQGHDVHGVVQRVCRHGVLSDSRRLFELVLAAVESGAWDGAENGLWLVLHDLGSVRPTWAVQAVAAFLDRRPASWRVTEEGRLADLSTRDHWAQELVEAAATGAPGGFCNEVLPLVLYAAHLTAYDDGIGCVRDRHFSHRYPDGGDDLDDALASGAAQALRALVATDGEHVWPWLHRLAVSELDVAQWLLYEAAVAAVDAGLPGVAAWAAEVILEGPHRFLCGTGSDSFFHAGELLRAISPDVPDEQFAALEQAVLHFAAPWDQRRDGRSQFRLLWSLERDRLSPTGKRRLAELTRRFGRPAPEEPVGVVGGFIGSPIPVASAERMTDEQWLSAMAKHDQDRSDFSSMTGGARELANVLQEQTKADPERFARLALRLDAAVHPAYTTGILLGLGNAAADVDLTLVVDAVRHIAALRRPDDDRWLGWALRKHLRAGVALDVLDVLVDRALHAADPAPDDLRWACEDHGRRRPAEAVETAAINCARGAAAESLGDLLLHDLDGTRTARVLPALPQLVADPSVPVRCAVAHLLLGCLRHARHTVIGVLPTLVDADDRLLATRPVEDLLAYLVGSAVDVVLPVLLRMTASEHSDVRCSGGRLLAYVGLELGRPELLQQVSASPDPAVRQGAAGVCARRLRFTANRDGAAIALRAFFNDPDPDVVAAAAEVAGALRGHPLRDVDEVLRALVSSPALTGALPQLLITLEHAPDTLTELVLDVVAAVLDRHPNEAGDIRTGISADVHHGFELVMRAYEQSHDAALRARALDLVDRLLLLRVYRPAQWFDELDR